MTALNSIQPHQLMRLIGTAACPDIIDLTIDEDFNADPYMIPSSRRMSHSNPEGIMRSLHKPSVVVLCQKGKKLSQGVCAWLRSESVAAQYLQGGMWAWRDHKDCVRTPASALPSKRDGQTLWVTRQRPKIDRIACPWLIRRFVDPNARFLFVSAADVKDVAEKFDAVPFDVEGAPYTHDGDDCSFDSILKSFHLQLPALKRMATVIRGADTNRHDLDPVCAGLMAISVGLSRQYRNDYQQLEAGMVLYDALYRWARDGADETHDWPGGHV
ncbi:MAG: chromate resistance protein ChrB domain-containing protein [Planktomarina sp.]